jgi:hypothetical protein
MDYPVLNKTPDVAQAIVPHSLDGNGNAVPQSLANPPPVQYFPKLINAGAAAMNRPANTTPYSAGDAVSNNATAASVTPISFSAADTADAPLMLTHLEILSTDAGPAAAGATFEAWLFNADPTANAGVGGGDNAAFAQKQAGFLGRMAGSFIAASDGSIAMLTPVDGSFIGARPVTGGTTIHALLKTLTAFTPSANGTTFTCTLRGVQGRA